MEPNQFTTIGRQLIVSGETFAEGMLVSLNIGASIGAIVKCAWRYLHSRVMVVVTAYDNQSDSYFIFRLIEAKAMFFVLDVARLTWVRFFGNDFSARRDASVALVSSDCPSAEEQREAHREAGNQTFGPGIHADAVRVCSKELKCDQQRNRSGNDARILGAC